MPSELVRSLFAFRYVIIGCSAVILLLLLFLGWWRWVQQEIAAGRKPIHKLHLVGTLTIIDIISLLAVFYDLYNQVLQKHISMLFGTIFITVGLIAGYVGLSLIIKLDPYRNASAEQRKKVSEKWLPFIFIFAGVVVVIVSLISKSRWSFFFFSFAVGALFNIIVYFINLQPAQSKD